MAAPHPTVYSRPAARRAAHPQHAPARRSLCGEPRRAYASRAERLVSRAARAARLRVGRDGPLPPLDVTPHREAPGARASCRPGLLPPGGASVSHNRPLLVAARSVPLARSVGPSAREAWFASARSRPPSVVAMAAMAASVAAAPCHVGGAARQGGGKAVGRRGDGRAPPFLFTSTARARLERGGRHGPSPSCSGVLCACVRVRVRACACACA